MGDLLVLRVGHHLAERPAARVPDQQHGVPLLAVLGHQRRVPVARVDDLYAVAGREGLAERVPVLLIQLAPTLGERVYVDPAATVIGDVVLGDDVSIWPGTVVRGDVNYIRVGARTNIQDGTIVHVTHDGPFNPPGGFATVIGADVTIGHGAIVHACVIEDACLIGMGATVLDGAIIRKHGFVGAGALIPPGKTVGSGVLLKVDGFPSGIYHHDVHAQQLSFLRELPDASWLHDAFLGEDMLAGAGAVFVITAVLPRARFKYGERAYRYVHLEAGHLAQNLVLAAQEGSLAAAPVGGFIERRLEKLLDIDGVEEFAVYSVFIGSRREEPAT